MFCRNSSAYWWAIFLWNVSQDLSLQAKKWWKRSHYIYEVKFSLCHWHKIKKEGHVLDFFYRYFISRNLSYLESCKFLIFKNHQAWASLITFSVHSPMVLPSSSIVIYNCRDAFLFVNFNSNFPYYQCDPTIFNKVRLSQLETSFLI